MVYKVSLVNLQRCKYKTVKMNQEINNCLQVLRNGSIILYPTDTGWALGCDPTNAEAVKKIHNFKKADDFVCLVADDRMLKRYVKEIPKTALDIIYITDKPTTIIYDSPQNLAANLIGEDTTIAIRIPDDDFCYQLSRRFNGAILAVTPSIGNDPAPQSFKDIDASILKGVDYVVNLQHEKNYNTKPSVIQLSNTGLVKVISI